jgi:hypothetical protein
MMPVFLLENAAPSSRNPLGLSTVAAAVAIPYSCYAGASVATPKVFWLEEPRRTRAAL